ncbi:hypothetical protein ACVB8X_17655 [Streptomyces sp. NRAIS4]
MSGAAPAGVTRTAQVCPGIYKSGLELVLAHGGAERAGPGQPRPTPGSHPDCDARNICLECG